MKTVIFDLDHTLYPEKTYVQSGFEAVARYLSDKYKVFPNLRIHFIKTCIFLINKSDLIDRQALHSYYLKFIHPMAMKPIEFKTDLPEDMQSILSQNLDIK